MKNYLIYGGTLYHCVEGFKDESKWRPCRWQLRTGADSCLPFTPVVRNAHRGPSMGLFRKSCIWVQRYEEHFKPPNKNTNIFQLFFIAAQQHIAKLCEPTMCIQNNPYSYILCRVSKREKQEILMLHCYMLHVTLRKIQLGHFLEGVSKLSYS